MARQKIDIGTLPNDDSGDTLRSGGVKINAMTAEIYEAQLTTKGPITGGGKVVNPDPVKLNYDAKNLKNGEDGLTTIQPIHPTADFSVGSLVVQTGPIKSDDYAPGFTGQGYQIDHSGHGELKSLSIRETLLVQELEVRKLRYSVGPRIDGPGGGKIETIADNGDGTYDITFPENPGLTTDDYALVQEFDPESTQVVRQSRFDITAVDGRSITAELLAGGAPQVGDDLAVVASANPNRDSLIYYDPYLPGIDLLDGLSDFAAWDARSPKIRLGLLDGMPDVGGISPSGYSLYADGAFIKNAVIEGSVTVTGGNAETKSGASAKAAAAESAAKGYSDEKIYRYARDSFSGTDDASVWTPKPSKGTMLTTPNSTGWPTPAGMVEVVWDDDRNATMTYTDRDDAKRVWKRVLRGINYPTWSDWNEYEDTAGSQAKANAAQSAATSYTDTLQNTLDSVFDNAISSGTTVIVNGFLKNDFVNTNAILVGDLSDGGDYALETYAQNQASAAEIAAKGYSDEKVFKYPTDAYAETDDASVYSPKPSVAVMEVTAGSWPGIPFGTITTYWSANDRATQVYQTSSGLRVYERNVYPSNYPNWSAWRQTEDTAGAQTKANAAESAAKAKTTALQNTLDSIFDDAISSGTTVIVNGFLKNDFVNTNAIVVGDLGDGGDYALETYAQNQASSAESAAKGYSDEKVFKYPTDAYAETDDASVYSPKPSVAVMEVTAGSWPGISFGTITTYWSANDRATQVYQTSGTVRVYERNVDPSNYPNWSAWRQTEDTAGAQTKANAAESAAKAKTTALQNTLDSIFDDAISSGTTVIVNGYIKTDFLDTAAILAKNAVISAKLSVPSGDTVIGSDVYQSAQLGLRDGILTAGGAILIGGQGIDIDARAGTAGEIEWHDTQARGNEEIFGSTEFNIAANKIEIGSHGFQNDDKIQFEPNGSSTLPGGITANTDYYVINATGNEFQISPSKGGGAVNITDNGSGFFTVIYIIDDLLSQSNLVGEWGVSIYGGYNNFTMRAQSNIRPGRLAFSASIAEYNTQVLFKEWVFFDKQKKNLSGSYEQGINNIFSQKIYINVTSGEPYLCRISGLPANGKSMTVMLTNESASNDIILRDLTVASLTGANFRTQNGDDIRFYDGSTIPCEWDGENEILFIGVDRGN